MLKAITRRKTPQPIQRRWPRCRVRSPSASCRRRAVRAAARSPCVPGRPARPTRAACVRRPRAGSRTGPGFCCRGSAPTAAARRQLGNFQTPNLKISKVPITIRRKPLPMTDRSPRPTSPLRSSDAPPSTRRRDRHATRKHCLRHEHSIAEPHYPVHPANTPNSLRGEVRSGGNSSLAPGWRQWMRSLTRIWSRSEDTPDIAPPTASIYYT